MNEWKALVGRITIFPATPSPPSAVDLYRQVWNSDPDNFQRQTNPLLPSTAQGKRGGMMANCSVVAGRTDFNLMPLPIPGTELELALIEDLSELRNELTQIIDALGRGIFSGAVSRVALYVDFLNQTSSFAEADKLLTKVIPDKYGLRLTAEEDVIFQVNCPYTSRQFPNISMNSITKWSVQRLQVVALTVSAQAVYGQGNMPPTQAKAFIAASVSFDKNNSPTTAHLSGGQQSALLREALASIEQPQRDMGLNDGGN